MIYGYARVSSQDQNLDRQIISLKLNGVEEKNIFCDKESGKNFERKEYKKLIEKAKSGDCIIIKSIDRLGRNYEMIKNEWNFITKMKKCDIFVLDMPLLDTRKDKNLIGVFIADIVLEILSFVAETERSNIKQRQKEGIKIAKEKGIRFGRPPLKINDEIKKIFVKYEHKEISSCVAISLSSLSKGTFYKYFYIWKNQKI